MARRDQVPRRSPAARWTRRILGLAATAAVLGAGVLAASMIVSGDADEVAARTPAATAEPAAPAPRQRGLTERQKAERRRAVAEVRSQGYEPVELDDYRAQQALRVLIGRPRTGTAPGLRAFFFARGRYLGHDATEPAMKLRPGRQLDREITLVYTLYDGADAPCCPSGGDTRVHFRWTGGELRPREPIPPPAARMRY